MNLLRQPGIGSLPSHAGGAMLRVSAHMQRVENHLLIGNVDICVVSPIIGFPRRLASWKGRLSHPVSAKVFHPLAEWILICVFPAVKQIAHTLVPVTGNNHSADRPYLTGFRKRNSHSLLVSPVIEDDSRLLLFLTHRRDTQSFFHKRYAQRIQLCPVNTLYLECFLHQILRSSQASFPLSGVSFRES